MGPCICTYHFKYTSTSVYYYTDRQKKDLFLDFLSVCCTWFSVVSPFESIGAGFPAYRPEAGKSLKEEPYLKGRGRRRRKIEGEQESVKYSELDEEIR